MDMARVKWALLRLLNSVQDRLTLCSAPQRYTQVSEPVPVLQRLTPSRRAKTYSPEKQLLGVLIVYFFSFLHFSPKDILGISHRDMVTV